MKNSILLKIYFFYIFLCTALPCSLFAISYSNPYTILAFFPFMLSIVVGACCGVKLVDRSILIIFVIVILSSLAIRYVHGIGFSPYLFMSIYVGYICYHVFQDDIIDRFVNVSYKLTVIGLFLWVLTHLSYNTMISIADTIGYNGFGASKSLYIYNINIDTLSNSESYGWLSSIIKRNSGYCWEPGRYSCFLLVTIYFYVIKHGLSFNDKKFLVLFFALLTTQSTTGYMVFLAFLTYWYMRGRKVNPIYFVLLPIVIVGIWSLPFMRDKITVLIIGSSDIDSMISNWQWMSQNTIDGYSVPQRFTGFWMQWLNLQNCNLWVGDGPNFLNHYIVKSLGINAAVSEGILGVFVKYGLIIGGLAYYTLLRSSYCFAKYFGQKQIFLLAAIFIGINFSYSFWENPLMITFWMWSVFSNQWTLGSKNKILTTKI